MDNMAEHETGQAHMYVNMTFLHNFSGPFGGSNVMNVHVYHKCFSWNSKLDFIYHLVVVGITITNMWDICKVEGVNKRKFINNHSQPIMIFGRIK